MKWLVGVLVVLLLLILVPFLFVFAGAFFGTLTGSAFDEQIRAQSEALVALTGDARLSENQARRVEDLAENIVQSESGFLGPQLMIAMELDDSGVFEYMSLRALHHEHIAPELNDFDLIEQHEKQIDRVGAAVIDYELDPELIKAHVTLYFRDIHSERYVSRDEKAHWYPELRPREPIRPETVQEMTSQLKRLADSANVPDDAVAPDVAATLQKAVDRATRY